MPLAMFVTDCKMKTYLMEAFKGFVMQISIEKDQRSCINWKGFIASNIFCKNSQTGTARARLAVFVQR